MATLVLSTIGNALGGPVGGAIGALIGQSLDQQILGGSKRGPKIGDFSIQSSSYGTQIPRIYGRMRVAGSVVWATDLVEGAATTGAKGQPDSVYSYSISIAVVVSSRPIVSVGRIWADGKLIRDETGTFKINTIFRLYPGAEDQEVDPLIASAEGIENTPAYRGLALAVFENLELVEFGNRIPFLTFEVIADDSDPSIGDVLSDASDGLVVAAEDQTLTGYAAGGSSIRSAVDPIIDAYGIRLFDDGHFVRSTDGTASEIAETDLGCSSEQAKPAKRIERQQDAANSLPSTLRLSFYDSNKDYQTGEARASAGDQAANSEQAELPVVIDVVTAGALAQQYLARRWAERDRLTLRLPPRFAALQPGALLDLPLSPTRWVVQRVELDSFVTNVDLRPYWQPLAMAPPTALAMTRALRSMAIDEPIETATALELFDLPIPHLTTDNQPAIVLAASSSSPTWNRASVAVHVGRQSITVPAPLRKSLLGSANSSLGPGDPYLLDLASTVEVRLLDPNQWLNSCDDDALAGGCNLAVLGDEVIQFGKAEQLDGNVFELGRLLRGRFGTEWASGTHARRERFLLIQPDTIRVLPLGGWAIGSRVTAELIRVGKDVVQTSMDFGGESLRPPSPVDLRTVPGSDGSLAFCWTPRSRFGWTWIEGIEAPVGESRERYAITIATDAGQLELQSDAPLLELNGSQVARLGSGHATIEVRQIGDLGVSRSALLVFELPGECS